MRRSPIGSGTACKDTKSRVQGQKKKRRFRVHIYHAGVSGTGTRYGSYLRRMDIYTGTATATMANSLVTTPATPASTGRPSQMTRRMSGTDMSSRKSRHHPASLSRSRHGSEQEAALPASARQSSGTSPSSESGPLAAKHAQNPCKGRDSRRISWHCEGTGRLSPDRTATKTCPRQRLKATAAATGKPSHNGEKRNACQRRALNRFLNSLFISVAFLFDVGCNAIVLRALLLPVGDHACGRCSAGQLQ